MIKINGKNKKVVGIIVEYILSSAKYFADAGVKILNDLYYLLSGKKFCEAERQVVVK